MLELRKGDYLVTRPVGRGYVLLGTFATERSAVPGSWTEFRFHLMPAVCTRRYEPAPEFVTVISATSIIVSPFYPQMYYYDDDSKTRALPTDRIDGVPVVWTTDLPKEYTVQEFTEALIRARILRDPVLPYDLADALVRTGKSTNRSDLRELSSVVGELHVEEQYIVRQALMDLLRVFR